MMDMAVAEFDHTFSQLLQMSWMRHRLFRCSEDPSDPAFLHIFALWWGLENEFPHMDLAAGVVQKAAGIANELMI